MQYLQPGTAAQVFLGCVVAFCSFSMQLHLHPYRERESNYLKILVDTQIFLTFMLSFIIRVLPSIQLEPFDSRFYAITLLFSVAALFSFAVGLTAYQLYRKHKFRIGAT